jgi:hypothetical protein
MITAHVADDPCSLGVKIAIVNQREEATAPSEVLRLHVAGPGTFMEWTQIQPGQPVEATLTLPGDIARALLDGLTRQYHGAEDTRALRRDYDAERKRVDDLTGHLAEVNRRLTALLGTPVPSLLESLGVPVKEAGEQ